MADDGNVKVFCRVRPPNEREGGASAFAKKCVTVPTADPLQQTVLLQLKGAQAAPKTFTFDRVFHELSSQNEVFELVGVPITRACLEGYNGTIFAYGQTGSGKTFTMQGPDDVIDADARCLSEHERALRGLVPRVLDFLFQDAHPLRVATDAARVEHTFACSFMEIYNERVYDLLDLGSTRDAAGLILRENGRKGVSVEGLIESVVSNARQAAELMAIGARNRRVGQTAMNRESSRSHSVFVLQIQSKETTPDGITRTRLSRFNLVDLAGSERQRNTEAAGERLKEAGSINKSLSALGNVIMGLVEQSAGKNRHVHYRDSKLTFLLKDSLGGNSKTFMIATVSPAEDSSHETLSTLKFAQRAKLIRNNAVINEDTTGSVVVLQEEILRLRRQLQEAQAGRASTQDLVAEARIPSNTQLAHSEAHSEMSEIGMHERLTEMEAALAFSLEKNEMLMRKNGQLALQAGHLQSLCAELKRNVSHLKLHLRLRCDGSNADLDEYESTAAAIEWRMKYEELEEAFAELQERLGSGQASMTESNGGGPENLNIMYLTLAKQLAQVIRDKHEISDRLNMKQQNGGEFEDKIALLESEFMARTAHLESQLNTLSTISTAAEEKAHTASLDLLHSKQKEAAWRIEQQRSETMIAELQERIWRLEADARKAQDTILKEKRNRVDLEIALRQEHLREKEDIEARLAAKLTDYFELKQFNDDLEIRMNAVISDKDELSVQFHELQAQLEAKSGELTAALGEIGAREDELRALSAERSAHLLQHKEELEALQVSLADASSAISQLELSKGALEQSVTDLHNEKAALETAVSNLEFQLQGKDKEIHELRLAEEKNSSLIGSLRGSCAELDQKLSESAQGSAEKSARIEELVRELAVSALSNSDLSNKLSCTENIVADAENRIRSFELEQEQLHTKVASLESTLSEVERARDGLADRLLHTTNEVSALTKDNSVLRSQLHDSRSEFQKELDSHIETKTNLESKSVALEQAKVEQVKLNEFIVDLENEKTQLNNMVGSLTDELAKKSELLQITEEAVRECKVELAERTEKYETALRLSEERCSSLNSQLDATIDKHEQFVAGLKAQHTEELQVLQLKSEQKTALHEDQVRELMHKIEDSEDRLKTTKREHAERVSRLQQDMQSLVADLDSEKQMRADDANCAQEKLNGVLRQHESALNSLAAATEQLKNDYNSKIDSVNQAINSAKATIQEREFEIKQLQTAKTALAERLNAMEATNHGLEDKIQMLQGERDDLIARVHTLECDLALMSKAKVAADDRIDSLSDELEAQVDLVRQRDAKINTFVVEVHDLKTNLANLSQEHSSTIEELGRSRHLLEEAKQSYEAAMSEARERHAIEVKKLTEDAAATTGKLESVVSSLQKESSDKSLEIDRLRKISQNHESMIAQLEGRVSEELRMKEAVISELSCARATLQEREQIILEKEDTIAHARQELERQQEEANEVKVRLSGRVQLLEADLSDLGRAHDLLTSSHDSLSKQHDKTVSEMEHLQAEHVDYMRRNKELDTEMGEAKLRIANFVASVSELNSELATKSTEIKTLVCEKSDLANNVAALRKLVAQREDEIDEKDSVMSGMEETIENLEAETVNAFTDIKQLREAELALRFEHETTKSELEKTAKELTKAHKAHRVAEETHREALSRLETLISDLRDELGRASSDLDTANATIKQKNDELVNYCTTVDRLNHEVQRLTDTCQDLTKKLTHNEEVRASIEIESKEKERSWEQARKEFAAALEESKARCDASEKRADAKSNELADCMTALLVSQSEVTGARNKISSLEEKSVSQLASSQVVQETLQKRISELDKVLDELRADAEKKAVEADEVEKSLEQELARVRHELDHSAEKLVRQRKRNDSLQELNGQLTGELQEKTAAVLENSELLEDMKLQLQTTREERSRAEQEALEAKQRLSVVAAEMEELSKAHEQLSSEVEKKMNQLKAKELEWEAKEMELKGRTSVLGEMEEQIADESKKLAEEKVLVAQRKKEAERIKRECNQLKVRVEDLETLKIQLTKEREKYRREVNMLTQRLDEISKENDKLVGHDNKRQKIQHHIKVKEENNRLQEEVRLLTEQKFKLEVRIEKLELTLKEKENIVNEAQIDPPRSPSSVKSNSSLRGSQHSSSSATVSSTKLKTDSSSVESSVRKRLRSRNE